LEPLKRILGEYKTLIVKMCGTLLALPCVLPLLECVNELMKFAQSRDVFISDYVATVNIYQVDLYMMYMDLETSF
jgi:hypothetical protein